MASEFKTVDVWIGSFPSRSRFDEFFAEAIGDNDDAPISEFAKAMQQTFYDHDFLEHQFHTPGGSVDLLLAGHSFSKSYVNQVLKAAAGLGVRTGNTTVVVWNREITAPASVVTEGYVLRYIGCFDCDPSVAV